MRDVIKKIAQTVDPQVWRQANHKGLDKFLHKKINSELFNNATDENELKKLLFHDQYKPYTLSERISNGFQEMAFTLGLTFSLTSSIFWYSLESRDKVHDLEVNGLIDSMDDLHPFVIAVHNNMAFIIGGAVLLPTSVFAIFKVKMWLAPPKKEIEQPLLQNQQQTSLFQPSELITDKSILLKFKREGTLKVEKAFDKMLVSTNMSGRGGYIKLLLKRGGKKIAPTVDVFGTFDGTLTQTDNLFTQEHEVV